MSDRDVYNHMIQRLASEALISKKATTEKEKLLETLQNELQTNLTTLLSARQEKSQAENVFKKIYKQWSEKHAENIRATDDIQLAVEQTKLKCHILEQREMVRKQETSNERDNKKQKKKEKKHVQHKNLVQKSDIQQEFSNEIEIKLFHFEEEFKKITEAAGTNDIDKIIHKFLNREETLRALKEEHAIADAKMRKLREKHKQLNEQLNNLRGNAVNTRTIYQEMDQTSEKLKDIEKDANVLTDKFNKANVLVSSFIHKVLL
jgi:DNA repair exonuclease SbcCD ATPase subunit